MPDTLGGFKVRLPYMTYYYFGEVLALSTLHSRRTFTAYFWIAFVFPVSFPIGGRVFQDLAFGAKIAIIILVVNKFVFSKVTFLVIGLL